MAGLTIAEVPVAEGGLIPGELAGVAPWRRRAAAIVSGSQVAALLRVSKRTVERLNVPSVKLGKCRRYLRDDVLAYLRARVL
jgi:hypothetical protein